LRRHFRADSAVSRAAIPVTDRLGGLLWDGGAGLARAKTIAMVEIAMAPQPLVLMSLDRADPPAATAGTMETTRIKKVNLGNVNNHGTEVRLTTILA
jgi:hypothetical protein